VPRLRVYLLPRVRDDPNGYHCLPIMQGSWGALSFLLNWDSHDQDVPARTKVHRRAFLLAATAIEERSLKNESLWTRFVTEGGF
jgi:hypothetical protein